jgi:hypothetical protein
MRVAALCATPVVAAAFILPAGASTSRAATLWTHAVAAASAQPSVHYVQASTGGGQTITITGDVNRTAGTQHIVFKTGPHSWTSTVTLVGQTAYVSGSAYALQLTLGVPASVFTPVAGKWISITPSDPGGLFKSTAAELTMASVVSNFSMGGPFTLGRRAHMSGVSVIGLHGYLTGTGTHTKVPQTFDVKATGSPLPIASLSQAPGKHGTRSASTYSRWGDPVSVQAPAGAVSIAQVLQGAPPGTTTTAPQIITA